MFLILVLVYLFHGAIHAAPVANTLRDTMPPDISSSNQCLCPNQQRSLWDILWSCLATIFACTWVSVHPNIPPAGEKWRKRALRRLELMVWGVIAPEMIIYWAMKQWTGARELEKKYHGQGWTKTHGHFIQMGGFTLYRGEESRGVLLPQRMASLLENGEIDLPKITEEEINDRSKGDGLSKLVAVGQTSWFVAQCIARRARGLIITELELVTVAFAVLNVVIYFLWWKKPLDVLCSVPVYLLDTPKIPVESDTVESPEQPAMIRRSAILSFIGMILSPLGDLWKAIKEFPSARIIWTSITDISVLRDAVISMLRFLRHTIFMAYYRLYQIFDPDQEEGEQMSSVPTFYSMEGWDATNNLTPLVTFSIASIFGSLHCAAWFFTFPSHAEQIIWRVCAACIAVLPGVMIIAPIVTAEAENKSVNFLLFQFLIGVIGLVLLPVSLLSPPVYFIARFLLLGEAFAALRFLPPAAVAVVDWIEFIPHI